MSDDVPSPIDFHDLAQALAWEAETIARRPARPRFFAAFVAALNARCGEGGAVLELGSGPGHLAEQIVAGCRVGRYAALDFSAAMHTVARQRLGARGDAVEFVVGDFRAPQWSDGVGAFDAVVTMQSVHEVRHTRHVVPLLRQVRAVLRPGGVLLYCDHYREPGDGKNAALHLAKEEQPSVLAAAGFADVDLLLDAGGMALYAASAS